MIISFSGNDGSGKSTLISETKRLFSSNSHIEIEIREEFNYFLLRYIFVLFGKKNTKNIRSNYLNRKDEAKTRAVSIIWTYLVFLDLVIEYFYLRITTIKSSKVIILDRCIYDFYVSWQYLNVSTSLMTFLVKIFPKYDKSLILTTTPKSAYERKKSTHSYPLSFYQSQTKRYKELITLNSELLYIDTSDTLFKTRDEVYYHVLLTYFRSHKVTKFNFPLFIQFLRQQAENYKNRLNKLKISTVVPADIEKFLSRSSYYIIKRFYFPSKNSHEDDLDVVSTESKAKILTTLSKNKIAYSTEPDRVDFDYKNISYDVHLGLKFWNITFIESKEIKRLGKDRYIPDELEYLVYSAHSVYKHGILSSEDLLSVVKIVSNNQKIKVKKVIDQCEKLKWEDGFFYFNNILRRELIENKVSDRWVPFFAYLWFWLILFSKRNGLISRLFIVSIYAYLRDRYELIRNIRKKIAGSKLFLQLTRGMGYNYETQK